MEKYDSSLLQDLKESLDEREKAILAPWAAKSCEATRRLSEERIDLGHRQNYAVDSDRILHSLAYTRYIDKTQVFYLVHNDHITHRVLHVQLVSKISRTIGRFLGLNEDLMEAVALGHDIGHCPFGHDGEAHLSDLCEAHGIGPYHHNVQSVRFLENIERKGKGLNLTLQVLDGILCHDGEIHIRTLKPEPKAGFHTIEQEMAQKTAHPETTLTPMTLEGCVVRMADTISYIGRDIEDAIRLNLLDRRELPQNAVQCLGSTNGTIVYNLVTDMITQSTGKPFVTFSPKVSGALAELRDFNLQHIYLNPMIKPHAEKIKPLFELLFKSYFKALQKRNEDSIIFSQYLDDMSERYRQSFSPAEIVRDFIAGMTDDFFLNQLPEELRPSRIEGRF